MKYLRCIGVIICLLFMCIGCGNGSQADTQPQQNSIVDIDTNVNAEMPGVEDASDFELDLDIDNLVNQDVEMPKVESAKKIMIYSFFAGGNEIRLSGKSILEWMLESGFQTDIDVTQPVSSCQVTDEFLLSYEGAELTVKACNPYENPVALSECMICYISFGDTNDILTKGDGTKIGITTYDEVDSMCIAYKKSEDYIQCKGIVFNISVDTDIVLNDPRGNMLLDANDDVWIIYDFKNGILDGYRLEMPALLYNGLQDNMDLDVLENVSQNQFSSLIEARNTVLEELKNAFAEAGVSVNINEATGEIVLESDILFDVDESELGNDGKQYIDNFMGIYAAVITSPEMADYISEVRFEGHTDSNGSYDYNLALSQARAEGVLAYCLESNENDMSQEQKTQLEKISTAVGYSFSDLVYNENGSENAEASRRVSIKFYIKADAGR